MAQAHENSIIRILSPAGIPVGTGFLISESRALTCAHVVAAVFGRKAMAEAPVDGFSLDFPLLAPGQGLTAHVEAWNSGLDVAVLEITGELSAGAQPARLIHSQDLWKHDFRAFGFPNGFPNGVWADGRILGREATGWYQVEDTKQTGYFIQPGFSGGAVWDESLGGVIGLVVAADMNPAARSAFIIPIKRIDEAFPALQMPIQQLRAANDDAPAPGEPPYMGLRYFDTADAGLFYGRESLTRALTTRLVEERFLAIVGASGSGKSSLARAGLIPAWMNENERGAAHVVTPGARPLESLAASLTRDSESVTATSTLMDDLARDPRSLHLYARKLLERSGGGGLLLVVDQFEETFTLCKDPGERRAFIENLLAAAEAGGALRIILTLRADFYHHCAEYDGLRLALEKHQAYIGAMTPDELREAITAPARAAGWDFQPGLVDLLAADVGQEPGALPLLSHALLETWMRRRGRLLTLEGYAAAGGVRKAIAQTAESVYGRLSPAEKTIARGIFLRLTELGEGTQDTRRRVRLDELAAGTDSALETVLKTLADARLVITAQDSAEVAHEALIREWPTLRCWLDEDRESLRLHRRLSENAREWDKNERDPAELYRGARLAQVQEWAKRNAAQLNPLEADFLQASRDLLRHERIRWAGIAGAGTVLILLVVLAVTGQLNRYIYQPLDMADYWVPIPAGSFQMGSENGADDEKPVHTVTLDAFEMGRYEVTNRQYSQCVRADVCSGGQVGDDSLPVVYVNWENARVFCEWIGGRLPTEAEWEYAARGGLGSKTYPWGNEEPTCAKSAKNGANFWSGCSNATTMLPDALPVGSFTPNDYGLYDMAGNAWEWTTDWFSETYYSHSSSANPLGPVNGQNRVVRGGAWNGDGYNVRVASRSSLNPTFITEFLGFRCARSSP